MLALLLRFRMHMLANGKCKERRDKTMKTIIKTALEATVVLVAFSGLALAQEAPILLGDFSASVRESHHSHSFTSGQTNPMIANSSPRRWAYPAITDRMDFERNATRSAPVNPLGNYSANVTIEELRGR